MTDKITEPGVFTMSMDAYHADPCSSLSLSASGAIDLVATCPATFDHKRRHPTAPKRHFDIGSAAHRLVLGRGESLEVIAHPDFKTKAAREARDKAYDEGRTPLLKADFDKVQAMAQAIHEHPVAAACFANGTPEQSLFWQDGETSIWCRSRPDWLPRGDIFADYKTSQDVNPAELPRFMMNFGYHQRAAWYLDGIRALGLSKDPKYLMVFQEKEPPYQVVIAQPSPVALEWGRIKNLKARHLFAECLATDEWPGYADDVVTLDLPGWAEGQLQRDLDGGVFDVARRFQAPLAEGEAA